MSSQINVGDNDLLIIAAGRTPIGSIVGSLSSFKAHQLGSMLVKRLLNKIPMHPSEINEVIMGQALTAGEGQNPARQTSINAGIPVHVPAYTVNKLCGSGLQSVILGIRSLRSEDADVVVCGGQESMSQAPHCTHMRTPLKLGNSTLTDTMVNDGLTDAFKQIHMGVTAEKIVERFNISREEQDIFAMESQRKAEKAQNSGYFDYEIIPISVKGKKEGGSISVISKDEHPRPGTTLEALKKLKPVFSEKGTITAGNASGVNDGAAAVIMCTGRTARNKNFIPLAKIIAYSDVGVEPEMMGIAPISAIKKVLERANWTLESVDLFEINEAFAAQSLAVITELNLDKNKVNVNGGAIALGHPIGASGARILVTLVHNLHRLNVKRGIAAICIGGGMGIAVAIEKVDHPRTQERYQHPGSSNTSSQNIPTINLSN